MKHKRIKKFSMGALLMLAFFCFSVKVQAGDWTRYQNSSTNNGVTENPAPSDAEHAVLEWEVKMSDATTPPLVIGDKVYTACDKYVYCYDKTTGKELGHSDALKGSVGFALHPMVYAEKKLFVVTENQGTRIEALDLSNPTQPKRAWCSDPKPGTSYSPLTYQDGCLYTGTWNGEDSGYYFCVDAGNGEVKWSVEDSNGFYWDGAYATDTYVAFASENARGGDNEKDGSALYTVNAKTGKPIDSVTDLKGSIRNTVVYDDGHLYVGTVAGRVYRIKVDKDGNLGEYSGENNDDFSYIDLDGRIKATMLVDQGQLYVGVEGKSSGSSFYQVIDCSQPFDQDPKIDNKVSVPDEPKGAPVLSTAEGGTRYVYFTCNDGKGGIYYFTNKNEDLSSCQSLFQPESSMQEKCISSLALDDEGTLYYTNDSKYLMAVSPKLLKNVEIIPSSGIHWKDQQFDPAVRSYDLIAETGVSEITLNIERLDGENETVSFECSVDGKKQGDNTTVSLQENTTTVELKVTRKAVTLSYRFRIAKMSSSNTSLGLLYYGQKFYSGGNLLPAIESGKTEYSVDLRKVSSVNDLYLWILPEDTQASFEVYAVENIKNDFGDDLKNGEVLDWFDVEKTGEYKYAITPTDPAKNTVIRVCVTSADGKKTQDYQVKFIRTEEHQHSWAKDWNYDSSYHWHECLTANCEASANNQKDGYGAHTGNWVTTRNATCTAAGSQNFTCTVCGYTTSRVIPPAEHKYGAWTVSSKATVFAAETQKRTCSVCKSASSRTVGKKLTPVLELPGKLTSLSIKKGKTASFTLTMADGDTVSSVTSGNTKYVKVSSYKKTGSVSLKAVKTGKASITIKLASGKTATYKVNVVSGTVKTTKVAVASTKLTLAKGKTSALKPVLTPFTSTQKITYKSSDKKVATVTSAGKIKAVAAGTAKITVTSGSKKAVVTVTVPGVSLSKTSVTIKRNKKLTLKPKRYGIADPVKYTSSNKKIATVNANGTIKGIKKGTVTITVKAGSYSIKCKVKVK